MKKEIKDNNKQEAEDWEDLSKLHLAWEMLELSAVVFAKTRFANLRAKTELPDRPKKEVQKLENLITHLKENSTPTGNTFSFNREYCNRLTKLMMDNYEKEISDAWLPNRYAEKQQTKEKITVNNAAHNVVGCSRLCDRQL